MKKRWVLWHPRCRDCGKFITKEGFEVPSFTTFPYEGWHIEHYCKKHGEEHGLSEEWRGPKLEVDA